MNSTHMLQGIFSTRNKEKPGEGGGGVLPYIGYEGMCRCEGYGFVM